MRARARDLLICPDGGAGYTPQSRLPQSRLELLVLLSFSCSDGMHKVHSHDGLAWFRPCAFLVQRDQLGAERGEQRPTSRDAWFIRQDDIGYYRHRQAECRPSPQAYPLLSSSFRRLYLWLQHHSSE